MSQTPRSARMVSAPPCTGLGGELELELRKGTPDRERRPVLLAEEAGRLKRCSAKANSPPGNWDKYPSPTLAAIPVRCCPHVWKAGPWKCVNFTRLTFSSIKDWWPTLDPFVPSSSRYSSRSRYMGHLTEPQFLKGSWPHTAQGRPAGQGVSPSRVVNRYVTQSG